MAFTPEVIVGIIGIIIGIISLIMSWFFTNKALEQADRNLKTQLLYEDKKHSLEKLQIIINKTKLIELREKLKTFLNSFEGNYVPTDVYNKIYYNLEKVEKFEDENSPIPTKRQEDEAAAALIAYYDLSGGLGEYEQFMEKLDEKFYSFQNSSNSIIKESLKKF